MAVIPCGFSDFCFSFQVQCSERGESEFHHIVVRVNSGFKRRRDLGLKSPSKDRQSGGLILLALEW